MRAMNYSLMQRARDIAWQYIVFHIVCVKDADYATTSGGTIRDNKLCKYVADKFC